MKKLGILRLVWCKFFLQRYLRKELLISILLIFSIIIPACANNEPLSMTYFPTNRHTSPAGVPEVTAEMILSGKLRIVNNSLRVRRYFGFIPIPFQDYLIIWPYGYSENIKDNAIQILDRSNRPVAQSGHTVHLEGTYIQPDDVDYFLFSPLPADIKGPFFLAGSVSDDYFTSSSSK